MSQNVTINGKKFVPSAELARQFGYSLDYISRLAREGKVDATRIGRQWFVETVSLKKFVEKITEQKNESREELRQKRKAELISHHTQLVVDTTNSFKVANPVVSKKVTFHKKSSSDIFAVGTALLGTVLVFTAGALLSVAYNPEFIIAVAKNVGHFSVVPVDQKFEQAVPAGALGSFMHTESEVIVADQQPQEDQQGIVVFDASQTVEDIERVRHSFSDEVEVMFDGSDTGVIKPIFKNQKGDEYQFLLVPLRDAS